MQVPGETACLGLGKGKGKHLMGRWRVSDCGVEISAFLSCEIPEATVKIWRQEGLIGFARRGCGGTVWR